MYVKELRNKVKTRKNGLVTAKHLPLVKEYEIENQKSAWLTHCHKNGCGRTVEFRKTKNGYQYFCTKCNDVQKIKESQGQAILGF